VSSALQDGDFARYEIDALAHRFLRLPRDLVVCSAEELYDRWQARTVSRRPDREAALAVLIMRSRQLASILYDFEPPVRLSRRPRGRRPSRGDRQQATELRERRRQPSRPC
jgi:hypothetical protein